MIGRGAQGQPWLPGQIGRRLENGKAEATPSLSEQLTHIRALYDEICRHYGLRIGLKHARKHLGWALDSAAASAGASAELLKAHRTRVLTADEPAQARRLLADAYDDFAWRAAA
jgi:tRNA-dihydrouridine synthase